MVKALGEVPTGTSIFIDANIFHLYLRGPRPIRDVCTMFLERIEKGEIKGYTSTLVLDELAYKLLLRKIEDLYGRNPLEVLRERREAIAQATPYVEEGLNIILGIRGLKILSIGPSHIAYFTEYMKNYSLLPRDALHLTLMISIGCRNIASADKDFDTVPFITRWSPIKE